NLVERLLAKGVHHPRPVDRDPGHLILDLEKDVAVAPGGLLCCRLSSHCVVLCISWIARSPEGWAREPYPTIDRPWTTRCPPAVRPRPNQRCWTRRATPCLVYRAPLPTLPSHEFKKIAVLRTRLVIDRRHRRRERRMIARIDLDDLAALGLDRAARL